MGSETAPRWLTEDQQATWRAFLAGIALLNERMDVALRPFGLDLGEYEILVVLSETPGASMRMSDLAKAVHQSRSRLTHTVSRMENKGLVTRRGCSDDRRGVIATLSEAGMDLLRTAAPTHVESVRHTFVDAVDPEDYDALGRAMKAMLATTP